MLETNTILIVDGSNLLFQMFFGMPSRIVNKEGRAIQGTLGFVGALLKIIARTRPTHAVVLFDSEGENPRCREDADYKANRPDYSEVADEENPFSQLSDVYAALDLLGIRHAEATGCEADDVIAAYALGYGDSCKVVISSFDSDFFQLINERVSVLRYRGKGSVICTPDWLRAKFGVLPDRYADLKALTGDTSDNVKGVLGVGPKTAANLLEKFDTLEGILQNSDKISRPSIRASIEASKEKLRTNYRIIKLGKAVPLPFSLDEMCYTDRGITTTEVLRAVGILP